MVKRYFTYHIYLMYDLRTMSVCVCVRIYTYTYIKIIERFNWRGRCNSKPNPLNCRHQHTFKERGAYKLHTTRDFYRRKGTWIFKPNGKKTNPENYITHSYFLNPLNFHTEKDHRTNIILHKHYFKTIIRLYYKFYMLYNCKCQFSNVILLKPSWILKYIT